jgi:hypothetical protein
VKAPQEELTKCPNATDMILGMDFMRNHGILIGISKQNRRGEIVDFVMIGRQRFEVPHDPSCACLMEQLNEAGELHHVMALNSTRPCFNRAVAPTITIKSMPKPSNPRSLEKTTVDPGKGGFVLLNMPYPAPYDCELPDQEVVPGVKIRETFWAAGHKEVCIMVMNFGEVPFPTQNHEQNGVEVNYRFRPDALVNDRKVKINTEVREDHKIESMDQKWITLEAPYPASADMEIPYQRVNMLGAKAAIVKGHWNRGSSLIQVFISNESTTEVFPVQSAFDLMLHYNLRKDSVDKLPGDIDEYVLAINQSDPPENIVDEKAKYAWE